MLRDVTNVIWPSRRVGLHAATSMFLPTAAGHDPRAGGIEAEVLKPSTEECRDAKSSIA